MTAPWRSVAAVVVSLLLLPVLALADGGGGGGGDGAQAATKAKDPDFTAGVQAIQAKQFARAIPLFEGVVKRDAVVGRFRSGERDNQRICFTGKGRMDPWVSFRASRKP